MSISYTRWLKIKIKKVTRALYMYLNLLVVKFISGKPNWLRNKYHPSKWKGYSDLVLTWWTCFGIFPTTYIFWYLRIYFSIPFISLYVIYRVKVINFDIFKNKIYIFQNYIEKSIIYIGLETIIYIWCKTTLNHVTISYLKI